MSNFLRFLTALLWPPHHQNDPRLRVAPQPDLQFDLDDEWEPGSTEKCLQESERAWIHSITEQASVFPLECYIRFEFDLERQTVSCHRAERMDQPRLELGKISEVDQKHWEHIWRFLYDHFTHSLKLKPLEGEENREFVVWSSPRKSSDPYSVNPNAVSVRLCTDKIHSTQYRVAQDGLDGPCTAH